MSSDGVSRRHFFFGADLNDAARTENIVALCDVDERRAAANFKKFDKAPKYKDFGVMLDKEGKNIERDRVPLLSQNHSVKAAGTVSVLMRLMPVFQLPPSAMWEKTCVVALEDEVDWSTMSETGTSNDEPVAFASCSRTVPE